MRVLSLCGGMGLMDRAFLDAGFEVTAGCEIDPDQRALYRQLCGGYPLVHDITDLPAEVRGRTFDGIIGGPPCQALTRLRAMRTPKFADLTPKVKAVLEAVNHKWFLFENVTPLDIPGAARCEIDAMYFAKPHQSRARWFTHSPSLSPPPPIYYGTIDSLFAYPGVYGKLYGPVRGAALQGYPMASTLDGPCKAKQKGIANAVHYGVALAWAKSIMGAVATAA